TLPLAARSTGRGSWWGFLSIAPSTMAVKRTPSNSPFAGQRGRTSVLVLRNLNPHGPQHLCHRNQRQADQRGGIAGFDGRTQADSQPFGFEAAGAVEGLLARQITVNFSAFQGAKTHPGAVQMV